MTREFKRERGFLTFAQNSETSDYLRLAYACALSLKATQRKVPWLSVVITPGMEVPEHYRLVFDEVIEMPWLDAARDSEWKLENEWKAYHVTPYRETIKLDADMLFTHDVSDFWNLMATQDVFACTTAETYRGEIVTDDYYRKVFTANKLPNVYTALMFFRYSDTAQELFEQVQTIYDHWQRFFYDYLNETRPGYVSTDVVFALAMKILGIEDACTHPALSYPRFVHMKSHIQNWPPNVGENWLEHVRPTLTDDLELKIGRFRQTLPVHYHLKTALTDEMIATYERYLGL